MFFFSEFFIFFNVNMDLSIIEREYVSQFFDTHFRLTAISFSSVSSTFLFLVNLFNSRFEYIVFYYFCFIFIFVYILALDGIFFNNTSSIKIVLYMEIIFITLSLFFVVCSFFLLDVSGCVYALLLITISAVESAFSLGLLIAFYKLKRTINISFFLNTKR